MMEVRVVKASWKWSHLNEGKAVRMFQSKGIASEIGRCLGSGKDGEASVPNVE